MTDASEAEQLAALGAAAGQRDVATVARLTRAATSSAVRVAGSAALAAFLTDDDHSPTPEETQHAVEALVLALRAAPADVDVQQLGCFGLAVACKASGEARKVAAALGAVEALVSALKVHVENEDITAAACSALVHFTFVDHNNCTVAFRAGALDALLDVVRAQPTHESMIHSVCWTLGYVCEEVAGTPAAAVQLGAPAVIIDALRSFPDSSMLHESAFFALQATLSDTTVDDDGQHDGAVSYVIHALRAHSAHDEVQRYGCMSLCKLISYQPVNAAEAWRLGALPHLLTILEVHSTNTDNLRECFAAARTLVLAVRGSLMPSEADAAAAALATIAAMRAHPSEPDVQYDACGLLDELALTAPRLAVILAEAGAMEALVNVVREFTSCDNFVAASACWALGNLAASAPAHRHRALAAGAIADVVTLMTTHSGNDTVQKEAAHALSCLCKDDSSCCAQAVQCGAVKQLCDAVRAHTGMLDVLQSALKALIHLVVARGTSAAAELVAAGSSGIGLVAQLLLSSTPQQDEEVLNLACGVFMSVTADDAAAMSSADVFLPLLHVLNVCSPVNVVAARTACQSLLFISDVSKNLVVPNCIRLPARHPAPP